MDKVDAVVVGAGVVGLAVARALAMAGREVVILEAENAFGTGVSARNSEGHPRRHLLPTGLANARRCACAARPCCTTSAPATRWPTSAAAS